MKAGAPARKRWRPSVLGPAAMAMALAAAVVAARAQYVVYHHVFGQWAVTCALDEPTARTRCTLRAPEPSLDPAAEAVRLDVVEPPAGETAVTLRFNVAVDAAPGVTLTVDGNPPHRAGLTRIGEAGWSGAAARALLDEMARGNALAIRFVRWGEAAPGERHFDLRGFPEARRTYLQRSGAAGAASR